MINALPHTRAGKLSRNYKYSPKNKNRIRISKPDPTDSGMKIKRHTLGTSQAIKINSLGDEPTDVCLIPLIDFWCESSRSRCIW